MLRRNRPRHEACEAERGLAVPFGPGDLGTAKTAGAVDPDALGAKAHRRLHGALHGAAEADAALKLLRDVLGDQLGVDLRLADLDDVQADLAADALRKIGAKTLDVLALLADDQAGTTGMDGDARGPAGRSMTTRLIAACFSRSIR